jgi:chromosome partitioning protein
LKNLGPTLRRWRGEWKERTDKNTASDLALPTGRMQPIGYVVLQHAVRLDRPVKAYEKWIARIPQVYEEEVLHKPFERPITLANDPNCLSLLKHYQSLMPMAQEAQKPMFNLKPADGAIGAHFNAVKGVYQDFLRLAATIAEKVDIEFPDASFSESLLQNAKTNLPQQLKR